MNIQGKEALRNALAAEYVLGTLRGAARRRFESWMQEDRDLAQITAQWQAHFAPLDELIPAVNPPARVWHGIVNRLPVLAPRAKTSSGWLQSLVFWKGLAGALGVAALFALALPVLRNSNPVPPASVNAYVATIEDNKTHSPIAVMMMPEKGNEVVLQFTAAQSALPQEQVLQLWMANPHGAGVVSAGLAPVPGSEAIRFPVPDPELLRHSSVVGLSLEPPGGSPSATHLLGFGKWTKLSS